MGGLSFEGKASQRPLSSAVVTEAALLVIIDQADSLHEGVANRGPDEFELPAFQVFAHGIGFDRVGRQLGGSARIL